MFESIGLHAALILNRLRNQRRVDDDRREYEEDRKEDDAHAEAPSGKLSNKRSGSHGGAAS